VTHPVTPTPTGSTTVDATVATFAVLGGVAVVGGGVAALAYYWRRTWGAPI
jgi:hypothetical protein